MWCIIGRFIIGTIGLGMLMVSGRKRVPNPPAIKIALRIPESLKSDIGENVSKLVRTVIAKYAFAPNRKVHSIST
jgi:hypothetical protein